MKCSWCDMPAVYVARAGLLARWIGKQRHLYACREHVGDLVDVCLASHRFIERAS